MSISGQWKAFNKRFGLFQNKKVKVLASSFIPLFDESATANKLLSNKIIEEDDSIKALVSNFMQETKNNTPQKIDSLKPLYESKSSTSQANKGVYGLRKDDQYLDVFLKMYYRAYIKKSVGTYKDIEYVSEVESYQLKAKFILSALESNDQDKQTVKIKSSLKEYSYDIHQYKCKCDDDTFYTPVVDNDYIKIRNGDYFASIEIAFDIDGTEEYILFKGGDCFFETGIIPTIMSNYHVKFDGLVHEYDISVDSNNDIVFNYFAYPTGLFLPIKSDVNDYIVRPGTQYAAYLKSLGIDVNSIADTISDDKISYAFVTYAAKKDDPIIEKTFGTTYDNLIGYTDLFNLIGDPKNFESYFLSRFKIEDGDIKCKVGNLFLPDSGSAYSVVDRLPIPVPSHNSEFYEISSSIYDNENPVPNNTFSLSDFRLKNLCLYIVTEEEVEVSFMSTADGRAFNFLANSVGVSLSIVSGNPYAIAVAFTNLLASMYVDEINANDYNNIIIGLTIASVAIGGYSAYNGDLSMSSAIKTGNLAVNIYNMYTDQMFNEKIKKQLIEKKEINREDRELQKELDDLRNPFMLNPTKKIDTYFDVVFELPSITVSIPDIMLQLPRTEINNEQVKKLY